MISALNAKFINRGADYSEFTTRARVCSYFLFRVRADAEREIDKPSASYTCLSVRLVRREPPKAKKSWR